MGWSDKGPPAASAPRRRRRGAGPRAARDSRLLEGRLEVLFEVVAEERLRLDHGLDPEDPLAQLRGARQPLGVPAEVLPELDAGPAARPRAPDGRAPVPPRAPRPLATPRR